MVKILVTGASGFLGNHLIQTLVTRGLDVVATCTNEAHVALKPWRNQITFKPYTISQTTAIETNLYNYFEQPDLMIHLAWKGLPHYQRTNHIEENFLQHYFFIKNLVQNGLTDLTVAGTCLEYGMQEGELHEEMPSQPQNPYAFCKTMLRESFDFLKKDYVFNYKWVRLFYMYGEGQAANSLIPQLEKALAAGEATFNMSPGDQLRDYLPIEMVSENMLNIALQKRITGIINCCSGEPISVKSFVESYLSTHQKQIELNTRHYDYASYEPKDFWGSTSKLKQIVPYESH